MHRKRPASLNDMGLLMFLAVTASLLGYCQTDEKVSFYGASYIHLPVQEAKGATDISFRFRTHLADAMLLLAAGKTDYCLIKLEAGRLKCQKLKFRLNTRGIRIFVIDIYVIMTSVKTAGDGDVNTAVPAYMKHVRNRVVHSGTAVVYKQVSWAVMRRTLTAIELA
ncbi:chondroitin sulfate proteoglycan 4 [Lasius niger]|uniref:Chondroitin sulfate proteoglycan 4 n=1 Tax=Lasius niger TaxID=67767 RepID=A0A0J7L0Z4_LASNI|nr:chondroitin sulfate proteoglycan 4 [Lasius niger]